MNNKFDVTKTNVAVDRMLETTENPRHRFLLQAYARHRLLEIAGRYRGDLRRQDDGGKTRLPLPSDANEHDPGRSGAGQGAVQAVGADRHDHLLRRERTGGGGRQHGRLAGHGLSADAGQGAGPVGSQGRRPERHVPVPGPHGDGLALRRPGPAGRRERLGGRAPAGENHQAGPGRGLDDQGGCPVAGPTHQAAARLRCGGPGIPSSRRPRTSFQGGTYGRSRRRGHRLVRQFCGARRTNHESTTTDARARPPRRGAYQEGPLAEVGSLPQRAPVGQRAREPRARASRPGTTSPTIRRGRAPTRAARTASPGSATRTCWCASRWGCGTQGRRS